MIKINGITNNTQQQFNITFEDSEITMTIYYALELQRWYANFTVNDNIINGVCLQYGTLLLAQYSNILPFDIIIITNDKQNPYSSESFTIGHASQENTGLFMLNQTEATQYLNNFIND